MAFLQGVGPAPAYVMGTVPQPGAYATQTVNGGSPTTELPAVIDGTPVRVVVIALSAAAGLLALQWAGFRFTFTAGT